ncbi:MAG: hypothetical protein U0903_05340 [Planctomycetales bacterium]
MFYFAFDPPPIRQTIIVAEDEAQAKPLQLAASIAPDPRIKTLVEVVTPERLATVEWEKIGSVLWRGCSPTGRLQKRFRVSWRGREVIFFPPKIRTKPSSTA